MAGCDGTPFLQASPEPLDQVAVVVDPVWASDRGIVALRRDCGPGTQVPDVLAKSVTGIAPVSHHPLRHAWQTIEQRDGRGQFMSLAGSQDEGDRPSEPVSDHAGLCAEATTRAAQRLTPVPLSLCAPFRRAPAAF